jgi:hypothetical protein
VFTNGENRVKNFRPDIPSFDRETKMNDQHPIHEELYKDLQELTGFEFPLQCPSCHNVYHDISEYLMATSGTDNLGGFLESYDCHYHKILEIIRRCVCGAVLLEDFRDRRDIVEAALALRQIFSRRFIQLREQGMSKDDAHELLLRFLNEAGRESFTNMESTDLHLDSA